ncbi:RasGEF protein [Metarhizium guizhouense ARSEF 977]|uniref:RasGEF protein n=1 Tax=Metarhizium guizhouense (strain ARSEF 977) TaxID=1276136 RepID=A0A0B4I6A5_METGA|nr:RasGEF protein [Metarhizium guizhouense ARSEF 977]
MGKGKPAKGKTKVTKTTRGAARRGSKTADGLRMSGDVEFDCLALDDQRAVDDFIKRMNLDIAESETSRRLKRRRSRHKIASEMIYSTYTKDMLETCLANIMVGIKRCPKSMKFINTGPGKPLSQLAPAVFNIPYLQDISARKDFLFTIATSLERMKGAESPSLRRKVEGLKLDSYNQSEENSSEDTYQKDLVRNGIECSLWNLMTSNIPTSRR